jgi:hypothetical protein
MKWLFDVIDNPFPDSHFFSLLESIVQIDTIDDESGVILIIFHNLLELREDEKKRVVNFKTILIISSKSFSIKRNLLSFIGWIWLLLEYIFV